MVAAEEAEQPPRHGFKKGHHGRSTENNMKPGILIAAILLLSGCATDHGVSIKEPRSEWTVVLHTSGAPWEPAFTAQINSSGAGDVTKWILGDNVQATNTTMHFSLTDEDTLTVYRSAAKFIRTFELSSKPTGVGCGTSFGIDINLNDTQIGCGYTHIERISKTSEDAGRILSIINKHLPEDFKLL